MNNIENLPTNVNSRRQNNLEEINFSSEDLIFGDFFAGLDYEDDVNFDTSKITNPTNFDHLIHIDDSVRRKTYLILPRWIQQRIIRDADKASPLIPDDILNLLGWKPKLPEWTEACQIEYDEIDEDWLKEDDTILEDTFPNLYGKNGYYNKKRQYNRFTKSYNAVHDDELNEVRRTLDEYIALARIYLMLPNENQKDLIRNTETMLNGDFSEHKEALAGFADLGIKYSTAALAAHFIMRKEGWGESRIANCPFNNGLCNKLRSIKNNVPDFNYIIYDDEDIKKEAIDKATTKYLSAVSLLKKCGVERIQSEQHFGAMLWQHDVGITYQECDMKHYSRQLRKRKLKALSHVAWICKSVGKKAGRKHVSDEVKKDFKSAEKRKKQFMKEASIYTQKNKHLANLADIKKSADETQLASIIAITHGMIEYAKNDNLECYMLTLTLPPEYHANPSMGGCSYDESISPDAAAKALQKLWENKVRREIHRTIGRQPFGIKTVEPQQDGCPHLHAMIFCSQEEGDKITEMLNQKFNKYANQCQFKRIEEKMKDEDNKTSVASYVLKYVIKAIQSDDEVYSAWKRSCNTRSYSFFGVVRGLVGFWQKIYNASAEALESMRDKNLIDAQLAMHNKQYGEALRLIGGIGRQCNSRLATVYTDRVAVSGNQYQVPVGIKSTISNLSYIYKTKFFKILTDKQYKQEQKNLANKQYYIDRDKQEKQNEMNSKLSRIYKKMGWTKQAKSFTDKGCPVKVSYPSCGVTPAKKDEYTVNFEDYFKDTLATTITMRPKIKGYADLMVDGAHYEGGSSLIMIGSPCLVASVCA